MKTRLVDVDGFFGRPDVPLEAKRRVQEARERALNPEEARRIMQAQILIEMAKLDEQPEAQPDEVDRGLKRRATWGGA
jgi:hypothetical protein